MRWPAGRRVVCIWATPRSVSTAFEKVLSRMPGAAVVHEPFTDCYYFGPGRRSRRYGESGARAGFDARRAMELIATADAPIVCVKDLTFQAEPYVGDRFLSLVTSTFMIRNPRIVMRSLLPLKPDFTEDEYGFTALQRMFQRVTHTSGCLPLIIDGSDLRASPRRVVRRYCEALGLPFTDSMLSWEDGRIREWSKDEAESQAKWHHTLEHSHGILPPTDDSGFDVPIERRAMYDTAAAICDDILARGARVAADGPVLASGGSRPGWPGGAGKVY